MPITIIFYEKKRDMFPNIFIEVRQKRDATYVLLISLKYKTIMWPISGVLGFTSTCYADLRRILTVYSLVESKWIFQGLQLLVLIYREIQMPDINLTFLLCEIVI